MRTRDRYLSARRFVLFQRLLDQRLVVTGSGSGLLIRQSGSQQGYTAVQMEVPNQACRGGRGGRERRIGCAPSPSNSTGLPWPLPIGANSQVKPKPKPKPSSQSRIKHTTVEQQQQQLTFLMQLSQVSRRVTQPLILQRFGLWEKGAEELRSSRSSRSSQLIVDTIRNDGGMQIEEWKERQPLREGTG